jgi:hypothetical protein
MPDIGVLKGLAQSMQYDQRIQDERFYDQQFKRAQAQNQAELEAFETDLDYMNAANSYDNNLIKGEADKTIREIGALVGQNPDWRYNPDVRRQINEKKKYLKSNQNVIRGMASDTAFKKLNSDLASVAKNPSMHDAEAYQNLLRQKNNYLKYGHQEGEEGLKRDGGPQAFVYEKPQDFVPLNEEALKTAALIKSRKYKDNGNGGWEELVDDNSLTPAAMDFYNRHKRQIQVTYNPKDDNEGIAYAKELIRPGIDLKRKFAEPHYNDALAVKKWEYAMANQGQSKTIDAYNEAVKSKRYNTLPTDAVTAMLGTTPEAKIYDADGSYKGISNGHKFIPSGSFGQVNTVGKDASGNFKVKSKETIGVAHGYIEMNETDYDNAGYDSDPKMRDKVVAKEITTPKGKKETVYWIPAQVEFNPNDEAKRFKFNNHVGMTSKQINELNPLGQTNNPNVPSATMQDWINAGWSQDQIKQGVQTGAIKVL